MCRLIVQRGNLRGDEVAARIGKESANIAAKAGIPTETAIAQTVELYCGANAINAATWPPLSSLLARMPALRHLDLSDNSFGNEGTMALAEALKANVALQSLNLRDNSIGAEGFAEITKARHCMIDAHPLEWFPNFGNTKFIKMLLELIHKTTA